MLYLGIFLFIQEGEVAMHLLKGIVLSCFVLVLGAPHAYAENDDAAKQILQQGLFGAGIGAIAAKTSGGKAGKGALVGAGSNILGNILVGSLQGQNSSLPQRRSTYRDDYYDRDPYPKRPRRSRNFDQFSYDKGYREGYREGYEVAYRDSMRDQNRGSSRY